MHIKFGSIQALTEGSLGFNGMGWNTMALVMTVSPRVFARVGWCKVNNANN